MILRTILLVGLVLPAYALAQSQCGPCGTRTVARYDADVTAAPPAGTQADSVLASWSFLKASHAANGWLFNNDPRRSCVVYLDGAFFTQDDSIDRKFKHGPGHANLPPARPHLWIDYLLVTHVQGVPGAYTATVRIESSTRELVASASAPFSSPDGAWDAGNAAAARFGSVIEKILEFEKRKRDSDPRYAIQPRVEFRPAKPAISVGEQTDVALTLVDCDEKVLANRVVELAVEGGGSVVPATVTTTDDGTAKTLFVAGTNPGVPHLSARYDYLQPRGGQGSDGGHGSIKVGDTPDELWVLDAILHRVYKRDLRSNSVIAGVTQGGSLRTTIDSWVEVSVVTKNIRRRPEVFEDVFGFGVPPQDRGRLQKQIRFWSDPEVGLVVADGIHREFSVGRDYILAPSGQRKEETLEEGISTYQPDHDKATPSLQFRFVDDTADPSRNVRYFDLQGILFQGESRTLERTYISSGTDVDETSDEQTSETWGDHGISITAVKTDEVLREDTAYFEDADRKNHVELHRTQSISRLSPTKFILTLEERTTTTRALASSEAMTMNDDDRTSTLFFGLFTPLSSIPPEEPQGVGTGRGRVAPSRILGSSWDASGAPLVQLLLLEPREVDVAVHAPDGRLLARAPQGRLDGGLHELRIDGVSDQRPSGICIVTVATRAPGRSATQDAVRLARIR